MIRAPPIRCPQWWHNFSFYDLISEVGRCYVKYLLSQQQAYLNNCLDAVLRAHVNREATGTTPVGILSDCGLLSLIEEADGVNIGVNDLVCMMIQIGLSDPFLQRELGAVRNPTLEAFNEKIGGFEQARRTTSSTAFGNAVSRNASSSN